ncbi:AIDA repeat-containing protein [Enterobacter sp. CFBP8995]|nr:AIDA repeat-containing protein [Enterobacter sp. CFBP8995]
MNRAYRIVWSAARQAWVVASERAGNGGRPPMAVKKAAVAFLLLGGMTSLPASAQNYNGTVVTGAGNTQTLNSGDTSSAVTVSNHAKQYVNSGATATGTQVTSSADQTIYAGGLATSSVLSDKGSYQYVQSGGVATGTLVDNKATQYVYAGGSVSSTTLSNGGGIELNTNANASGITINSGGRANIAGGSANTILINSGGTLSILNGAVGMNINQQAGGTLNADTSTTLMGINRLGAFSISGGQAQSLLMENNGILSVLSATSATNTTVASAGLAVVESGGTAIATTVLDGGNQTIYSGGSALFSVINGGQEVVSGTATGTTVNNNGQQNVSAGGVAAGTVVNSGGQINNFGTVTSATINDNGKVFVNSGASTVSTIINSGGIEYLNSGGLSTAAQLNSGSYQTVYAGGEAISASVTGGTQQVLGMATSTMLNSGGAQYVYADGIANGTLIGNNAAQGVGGTANSTTVAAGGAQYVYDGGSANWTTVTNNGYMNVQSGGSASGAVVKSGGTLYTNDGATATGLTLASGAVLNTRTGATLNGNNALGAFSISGGQAKNVLLENNGFLDVEAGDASSGTILNSAGRESVSGSASGTTVNAGGLQSVKAGGTATGTLVNSGGREYVEGSAIATTVNDGGMLTVFNGGIASRSIINQGGLLSVASGGVATDTTVATGGLLNIADGGVLTLANSNFINDGVTTYDTSTNASLYSSVSGSGQLIKSGAGTLTLGGTFSQSQVNLNAGALVMDGLQATTNIVALSGTSLSLTNSTILTGIIDPTDVNIDQSSSWNITGDSLVDTLTNAGSIVFVPSQGAFTPHTLTVTNLAGNGGTITLNTVAGDSSSPIDKVIVDGGQATGSTGLRILNRSGLGAQTTGSGIAVIQAINGATTEAGAFSMNQPLVAGAYAYSLYRNADQSWYLTSQQTQQPSTDNSSTPDLVATGPVNYRDGMWSYAALPSQSLDYDRLMAGTADTRFQYAPDSRVWGRLAAGQLGHPDRGSLTSGSVPESSGEYSFLQLGGDLWQLDGVNANWRAGLYGGIGLVRSDVWRDGGTGAAGTDRDTVYTGGAYLSGRSNAGLHIDGLLQASHHSLSVASNDSTRLKTSGTGWLASAEVGQAFSINSTLALEPQLQYTVQGLSLDDGQDEAASINWSDSHRQSVRAGLKLSAFQDAKTRLSWWVTPSVTQTYGGHSEVKASVEGVSGSDASFRSKLSGTGIGLNGGVDANIRENVTLGVQGGWSESLHGGESEGYYGMVRLGVSFR